MWVIFDKFGKILKSLDIDCAPARMGTTDFKIFAIFLDRDISSCSAMITFERPDYNHLKTPSFIMTNVSQREFNISSLGEDKLDYAPLVPGQKYDGFEFDFNTDDGLIWLDTNGEWKYTIDLYEGSLEGKRYVYLSLKNATINDKATSYDILNVGDTKTYEIKANTGYKLPKEIDINLEAGQYSYDIDPTDITKGTLKIISIQENVVCEVIAKKHVTKTITFNLTDCHLIGATSPITFDVDEEQVVEVIVDSEVDHILPASIDIIGEDDYKWELLPGTSGGVNRKGKLTFSAHKNVTCTIKAIVVNAKKLKLICMNGIFIQTAGGQLSSKEYDIVSGDTETIQLVADTGVALPDIIDVENFIVDPIAQTAQIVAYDKTTGVLKFTMNTESLTTITIKGV